MKNIIKGFSMQELRKSRHAVYILRYHVIFVTKYRKPIFRNEVKEYLIEVIKDVSKKIDIEIIEINGEEDHIHFIMETKPDSNRLSVIVNIFKAVTSRLIRKRFKHICEIYYGKNVALWGRSYFIATVGNITLETLVKYIENQDK